MNMTNNTAAHLMRLSGAIQMHLNNIVVKSLNGSPVDEKEFRQLKGYMDRLSHEVKFLGGLVAR